MPHDDDRFRRSEVQEPFGYPLDAGLLDVHTGTGFGGLNPSSNEGIVKLGDRSIGVEPVTQRVGKY